ncbi:thioredoxin domain-containing protein [Paenibacillus thermotolerans]|uniref:thioredoxin domain-containing protein n=1 Tax=Paenibacillus thermotolerans TaxID=3027807 RepID=UPI0023687B21|nr:MULTISPECIES: thioredoxin domain-containing protein [unclassified Paenibacillus]
MSTSKKPNRLAKEKSPYLLQHAYNPVDWFPWSDEAFDKAKLENKPVFLSIGYSTCHWCHVMERESFEDDEVAELLNRDYVAIKVDREERPDVDNLYMAVCQAMTGHGGWPLTIVMTPEKKPFFAGTYFPKTRKFGRHGLMEILAQLAQKWRGSREEVLQAGETVAEHTAQRSITRLKGEVSEMTLDEAYVMYTQLFDAEHGGFGDAPKFPTPHNLLFLLRYYALTGEDQALDMVEKTLDVMHRGGIYDHIGFGFARYSTDEAWLVPHFEKMLYDNALLIMAYTEAYQVTGKKRYAEVAEQIVKYVLRDMTDSQGGFYSAEDADSEGVEGKFYVWTPQEVAEVLGEEDGDLFCELFDITEEGNFEGHSIPNLLQGALDARAKRGMGDPAELAGRVETMREKLFAHRERRIRPGKDDKILTSWNGLMIAALAKASAALGRPEYADAARRAAAFALRELRTGEGRLLARYRDGEAAYLGYIDDYAFLIWGLIELYEASFEIEHMKEALEHTRETIRLFWDDAEGGFFFAGEDAEQLFTRLKEVYDGALPSGNSAMAYNLLRLSRLTGDTSFADYADRTFRAFAGAVQRYPSGHALMLTALSFAYGRPMEIVIAGEKAANDTAELIREVHRRFLPNAVVALHTQEEDAADVLPPILDKTMKNGQATVYVCENYACQSPVNGMEALRERLDEAAES